MKRLLPWTVRVLWLCGWLLAMKAGRANTYFEPTEEALRAAHDAVPVGIAGSVLMLVAAFFRVIYRPLWSAATLILVAAVSLLLFSRAEASHAPLLPWQLLPPWLPRPSWAMSWRAGGRHGQLVVRGAAPAGSR